MMPSARASVHAAQSVIDPRGDRVMIAGDRSTRSAARQVRRSTRRPIDYPPPGRPVSRFVEIRSYQLKPRTGAEFHRLVADGSIPMLRRWGVDVVAYGASRHDEDSYYLIRSYASLAERQQSQDAFYGSDEWQSRRGPIIALIESHTSIVLELSDEAVDALRRAAGG